MPSLIRCPCGQQLQVQDGMAGQRVRCPTCGSVLDVPAGSAGGGAPQPNYPTQPQAGSFGAPPKYAPPNYSPPNQAGGSVYGDFSAPPDKQGMSTGAIIAIAIGGVALMLLLVCGGVIWMTVRQVQTAMQGFDLPAVVESQELTQHDEDYMVARETFRTQVDAPGPSPQVFDPSYRTDLKPVTFKSGDLLLSAYVDPPPADGQPRPAVLFLHSGFAFGEGDYEQPQPYRDAGYVVLIPVLRGENGQPGNFTMMYDELDDVLAAADALAALPYVDRNQVFVAGYMEGGLLAALAAMSPHKFRGAAAISAAMNLTHKLNHTFNNTLTPFATDDLTEFEMRSPISFPGSFKCPTRLYYGASEFMVALSNARTAELARAHGLDVQAEAIPGNQFTAAPAAIQKSIDFFNQLRALD